MRTHQGFTLLEVLVALVILSVALLALVKASGQSARVVVRLKQKAAAHWVAMNALAEIRLSPEKQTQGEQEMLGYRWHWVAHTLSSAADYQRVTIRVNARGHPEVIETLSGFVAKSKKSSM